MPDLKIELKNSDTCPEIAILVFDGELDTLSIQKIGGSFNTILEGKYLFGIADMTNVSSISSAALGELMGCRTRLLERGGDLVLAGLSMPMREKLTAMDANRVFKFYTDVRSSENSYNWEFRERVEKIELRFPSVLKFVPPVRQLASRIARQKGYGNRDVFRIETIVDEVCNNAIEHGTSDENSFIDIFIKIDKKKIEIKVVNNTDPARINALKEISKSLFVPKSADDDVKRGRGLALVKMLSNDFEIEYSELGTSVHVTKLRGE